MPEPPTSGLGHRPHELTRQIGPFKIDGIPHDPITVCRFVCSCGWEGAAWRADIRLARVAWETHYYNATLGPDEPYPEGSLPL